MKRNVHAGGSRSRGLSVNVFTDSELDDIHLATLGVLERTGVFVEADEALDVYSDGGCTVDREAHTVRIPPWVAEEAIASAPSRLTRSAVVIPAGDIVLEPGRVGFTNFSEGVRVIDVETGEYRASHPQGRRRHRPPQRLPQRDGHVRRRRGGAGCPAGDCGGPPRRSTVAQYDQTGRRRTPWS